MRAYVAGSVFFHADLPPVTRHEPLDPEGVGVGIRRHTKRVVLPERSRVHRSVVDPARRVVPLCEAVHPDPTLTADARSGTATKLIIAAAATVKYRNPARRSTSSTWLSLRTVLLDHAWRSSAEQERAGSEWRVPITSSRG